LALIDGLAQRQFPYHLVMTYTGERRQVIRANRKSPTMFMILVALMMVIVALTRDIRADAPPSHSEKPSTVD
jgi:hypothetical protein